MVGGGTPGPCRAAGDLPLSPELFQSFGPILNRSRAAGAVEKKIQYIGIILISRAGETGRFICLSQCPRTSGGRSQRSGECEISMPLHRCRACLCYRFDLQASAPVEPRFCRFAFR